MLKNVSVAVSYLAIRAGISGLLAGPQLPIQLQSIAHIIMREGRAKNSPRFLDNLERFWAFSTQFRTICSSGED